MLLLILLSPLFITVSIALDRRVSFQATYPAASSAAAAAALEDAGYSQGGEKKFPDGNALRLVWKWLEASEAERLLPFAEIAKIGNFFLRASEKRLDTFACSVGISCSIQLAESMEEISDLRLVPVLRAQSCLDTTLVTSFPEISGINGNFVVAAAEKPGNFLVCACDEDACSRIGDLEISGPIRKNFRCIRGDENCGIGDFAGKGLTDADKISIVSGNLNCGEVAGEVFSLAQKIPGNLLEIGNYKICYCMENCEDPESFVFHVGNFLLQFPITQVLDFDCLNFPCRAGPWEKISDFPFSVSDSVSLVPGDVCGAETPLATWNLEISGDEISVLFPTRVRGGVFSLCFCGGSFFARPEICENPGTNARVSLGKISIAGASEVTATGNTAAGASLDLEISGVRLEEFPSAVLSSPDAADLRNFQVPLRGGNFRFFWQPDPESEPLFMGNISVSGPLRTNFQVTCTVGVRCRLPKIPRVRGVPGDALAVAEESECPEIATEKFPINGFLEATFFQAGGLRPLCFCGEIGNCVRVGSVSVRGPAGFNVLGPAVTGAEFLVEIFGREISRFTDAVRAVNQKISDCTDLNGGKVLTAELGSESAKYKAYFEYAGNFFLCYCTNATGGCGVPTFPIPGEFAVRGPVGLEISDTEFPSNAPFAGRATKMTVSGVAFAEGDRVVFSFSSCSSGNYDSTISDLSSSTAPTTISDTEIVFSDFRFTFGGLFFVCFKPEELSGPLFPITVGTDRVAVTGPFPLTISDFFAGEMSEISLTGVGLDMLMQIRVAGGDGSEVCASGSHSSLAKFPINNSEFVPTVTTQGEAVQLSWSLALLGGGRFSVCFCGDDTFRKGTGYCKSFIPLGSFGVRGPSDVQAVYVCIKGFDCVIGPVEGYELSSYTFTASLVSVDCEKVSANTYTLTQEAKFPVGIQNYFGSRKLCVCAGGSCVYGGNKVAFSAGKLFVTGLADGTGESLTAMANIAFSLEVVALWMDDSTRVAIIPATADLCDVSTFTSSLVVGTFDTTGTLGSTNNSTTSRIWSNIKVMRGGEYVACFTAHRSRVRQPVAKLLVNGAQAVRLASLTNATLTTVQMQATFTVEIFGTGLRDDDKLTFSDSSCGSAGSMTNTEFLQGSSFVRTISGVAGSSGDSSTTRYFSFNKFVEAETSSLTFKICWCPGASGCSIDSNFAVSLGTISIYK